METGFLLDEVFGERLLVSINADQSELQSNIRAARAILASKCARSLVTSSPFLLASFQSAFACSIRLFILAFVIFKSSPLKLVNNKGLVKFGYAK